MNEHEVKGAVRHVKGRAESASGSIAGNLGRQAEGAYDQIAGGAQHTYGKLSDATEEFVEDASDLVRDIGQSGKRNLQTAGQYAEDALDRGRALNDEATRNASAYASQARHYASQYPARTLLAVAAAAFTIGWMLRPQRR